MAAVDRAGRESWQFLAILFISCHDGIGLRARWRIIRVINKERLVTSKSVSGKMLKMLFFFSPKNISESTGSFLGGSLGGGSLGGLKEKQAMGIESGGGMQNLFTL